MPDRTPRRQRSRTPKASDRNAIIEEANKVGHHLLRDLGLIQHEEDPASFANCIVSLRNLLRDKEQLLGKAIELWVDDSPPRWEPTASGALEGVVKIGQRVVCAACLASCVFWTDPHLESGITEGFCASSIFIHKILVYFDMEIARAELTCSAKRLLSAASSVAPFQLRDLDMGWKSCIYKLIILLPNGYSELSSDKQRAAAIRAHPGNRSVREVIAKSPWDNPPRGVQPWGSARRTAKGRGGRSRKIPIWFPRLEEVLARDLWQGWRQKYRERELDYRMLAAELNKNWDGDPVSIGEIQEIFKREVGRQLLEENPKHKRKLKAG